MFSVSFITPENTRNALMPENLPNVLITGDSTICMTAENEPAERDSQLRTRKTNMRAKRQNEGPQLEGKEKTLRVKLDVEDPASKKFGERLKSSRQAKGLTLDALSIVTKGVDIEGKGVSRVSLSRYETGSMPGLRELRLLSLALRQTLSWLVYGEPEDPMQQTGNVTTFEDEIARIVSEVLASKGIIEPIHQPRYDPDYVQLVEDSKKSEK